MTPSPLPRPAVRNVGNGAASSRRFPAFPRLHVRSHWTPERARKLHRLTARRRGSEPQLSRKLRTKNPADSAYTQVYPLSPSRAAATGLPRYTCTKISCMECRHLSPCASTELSRADKAPLKLRSYCRRSHARTPGDTALQLALIGQLQPCSSAPLRPAETTLSTARNRKLPYSNLSDSLLLIRLFFNGCHIATSGCYTAPFRG